MHTFSTRLARHLGLAFLVAATPMAAAQSTLSTYSGAVQGSRFGAAVSFVSDLNGDGVADLLVGCPDYSVASNGVECGSVRVYSGATQALIRTHLGAAAGDQFGYSVTQLGDVDGDGRGDYAVGIPYSNANGNDSGQVQVFSGKTGALLNTFTGGAAGDRYGWVVRGIAGFGGAPKPMLAIGAPYAGASDTGAVYLRCWDGSAPGFAPTLLVGAQANEHFGWSIAFDGELGAMPGQIDYYLAVGSPGYDGPAGSNCGKCELWRKPWLVAFAKLGETVGTAAAKELGTSLAFSDMAGTPSTDLSIGAPGAGSGAGEVTCHSLTAAMPVLASVSGSSYGAARFGEALASGISLIPNNQALWVGAPETMIGGVATGAVVVFSDLTMLGLRFDGIDPGSRFGAALAGGFAFGGDVTGDGLDDVMIAAPDADMNGKDEGWVFVRHSPQFDNADLLIGPFSGDKTGYAVAGIGDVNNDGTPDCLVGSPGANQYAPFTFEVVKVGCGTARVISGASGLSIRAHLGDADGDEWGFAVAALGDIDLDGIVDYVVGAPQRENPTNTKGYARVYSGASGALLYSYTGAANGNELGYAVGGGSDVNGDGRRDILIGSPGTANGTVTLFSGVTGLLLGGVNGAAANDRFGASVAGLGDDLTGDGREEYLVGAPGHDNGFGSAAGAAYMITSTSSLTTKYVINGLAAVEQCGACVAAAGDVNRDGVVDFIVGVPGYALPAGAAGRIRVFNGASGAQLYSITGDALADGLGASACALGDIDNDGYADFAAGTNELESAGTVHGNGYVKVISGKAGDLLFLVEGSGDDSLGFAVAGAGDVDHDGIPDLVAGGPYSGPGTAPAGSARLVSLRPVGISFYGTVPNGCAGPEFLASHGVPAVGNAKFGFRCNHAPPSSLGLLLVTNAAIAIPTGIDVFGIGAPLLVDLFAATELYAPDMFSDAAGFGFSDTPLPANPGLTGHKYYGQVLWLWPGAACALPPFNLSVSAGIALTIE